ncbi:metallophosphatase [Flavobacterium psychrophilum]|nr:metallophosphatase [Flavobacterium psychrophilum]AOE52903.1 metallophosphatase [Flavobacterium psychrophilum]
MSRTFVIGDIHGSYKAVLQLLERAAVTPADKLIFLGDYVDGWGQSPEVLDFLIDLKQTHHCIYIRGNHDDLFLDWLRDGTYTEEWFFHGGRSTTEAYKHLSEDRKKMHILFLESLTDYFLDDNNRLFVHAGFTSLNGIKHEYFTRMFFWDRTLWETAMSLDKTMDRNHPEYPKRLTLYKEIFIGHTPVTRIGETVPINRANVWNVDTGAAFKGPVTIMDIDTKEFWQSDPAYTLYPDENGRN